MLRWMILGFVACFCTIQIVICDQPDLTAAIRNLEIVGEGITNDNTHLRPPSEQEKIDTIKSALDKLPHSELSRLGINLDDEFLAGTTQADLLISAWNRRQKELKDALAGMIKPVEHMQEISNILQNTSMDDPSIIGSLVVLESLLADVDNARDFHTIGGWEVISSILHDSNSPVRVKSAIASCAGTAVKNNYDYQLWTLESVNSTLASGTQFTHPTLISIFVSILEVETIWLVENMDSFGMNSDDVMARAAMVNNLLYAIFSAVRGNPDVQEALQSSQQEVPGASRLMPTLATLGKLVLQNSDDLELHKIKTAIARKIWGFASDMLDEWVFIHGPHGLTSGEQGGVDVQKAAMQLKPLGNYFLQDKRWLLDSTDIVWSLSTGCISPTTTAQVEDEDKILESVPSATPVDYPLLKKGLRFNEECQVLTSLAHRAIFQSAQHVRKQMLLYSEAANSLSDEEQVVRDSVELSCMMLSRHPLLQEHDIVAEVIQEDT